MNINEVSSSGSPSPDKPATSLTDKVSEDDAASTSSNDLGPIIKTLGALQPSVFSTVETSQPSKHIQTSAVVLSCPHAGRIYPAEFIAASIADIKGLRSLEDFGVDQLISGALEFGVTCVTNKIARAYIDVNRPVDALDYLMLNKPPKSKSSKLSRQVRAGYGLLPRLTAAREVIHRQLLSDEEVESRIQLVHQPYHFALKSALGNACKVFDRSFLVDCHSMPPTDQQDRPLADIILGDLHHNTLDRKIGQKLAAIITKSGFSIGWNTPYAGGHITKNYGVVNTRQQSLQIEINRRLYMSRKYVLDPAGAKRVAGLLNNIFSILTDITSGV
ncbi:N-formylglutamate amidohydrolase [Candidatus Puniceispirillum sp.]|nr:N-formylglutamate amidohydrolase [Candidatus Puniceispirillum sp.]